MNQVSLIGRLGGDTSMKYTQSGMAVANFSIAVGRLAPSATESFGREAQMNVKLTSKGGEGRVHSCAWSIANHLSYLRAETDEEKQIQALLESARENLFLACRQLAELTGRPWSEPKAVGGVK